MRARKRRMHVHKFSIFLLIYPLSEWTREETMMVGSPDEYKKRRFLLLDDVPIQCNHEI
jgi:hypothetical protein